MPAPKVFYQVDTYETGSFSSLGTWSSVGSLITARREAATVKLNDGRIMLCGGSNVAANTGAGALSSCEIWDPVTGVTTATAAMPGAKYLAAAWNLPDNDSGDGEVLVSGGWSTTNTASTASYIYTPRTNSWRTVGALNSEHTNGYWLSLSDDRPLISGGGITAGTSNNVNEIFDINAETWAVTGAFNTERKSHTLCLLSNGDVLAIAGRKSGGGVGISITSCEIWNHSTELWSYTADIPGLGMRSHASITLPNNDVFTAGGSTDPSVGLNTAYRWNSTAGWATAGTISASKTLRSIPFFGILPRSGVVIGGGGNPGTYDDNTDIYLPISNRCTTSAGLFIPGSCLMMVVLWSSVDSK
jgi:hypothetical protein